MRFEEVVDFPNEREAYMIVKGKLGLSEDEYLGMSLIERRELALAYRVAKKLGMEHQDALLEGYGDTKMFDENGIYDLAEATMIIKEKALILSLAKTKLGLADSIEEFVLKGNHETNLVASKLSRLVGKDKDNLVEHIRPLIDANSTFNFADAD